MSLQVGQGNQIINYNYRLDVYSKYLNKLLYNTMSPGILYDGTNHSHLQITSAETVTGNSITINPISFVITPRNRPDILVKVDTTDCFVKTYETSTDITTITVTDGNCTETSSSTISNIKLVARFNWLEENNNVAEFVFTFSPLEYDIILCEVIEDTLNFTSQTVARLQLIKPNATYDDSDSLDCYIPGNSSGNIPINNQNFNENLNASTLQLYDLSSFGINDGTIQTDLVSEKINGYTLQPQDGLTDPGTLNDIPISNGILQKGLNAQYLNGKNAAYFLTQTHTHDLDDLTNNEYSKVSNVDSFGKLPYTSIQFDNIGVDKLSGIGYDVDMGTTYNLSTLSGEITSRDVSELNQADRYIVSDVNNKFYFYENTTSTLITSELTNGNYGADELATLIETAIETDGVNTYTVVYNTSTNTFDFSLDSGTDFQTLYNPDFTKNGNFESWTSVTDVDDWTETLVGTSTVNQESVLHHGGTYCVRMDVDVSNNNVSIDQTITLYTNDVYNLNFWYLSSAGKTAQYYVYDTTTSKYLQSDGSWAIGVYNFTLSPVTSWTEMNKSFTPETDGSYKILISRLSAASSSLYFDDLTLTDTTNISDLINFSTDSGFVTTFSTDTVFGEDFYTYVPEETEIDFENITGVSNIRMRNPKIFLQKVYKFTDIPNTNTSRFALRNAYAYDITSSGFKVKQFPQVIISTDAVGVDSNTYIKVDRDLKEEDFIYYWTVFGEKYIES